MKRDIDLVRDILFYIEKEFDPSEGTLQFSLEDVPEDLTNEHAPAVVLRHIVLLWEAGLVDVYLPEDRDDIQRTDDGTAAAISVGGLTTRDTNSSATFGKTRPGSRPRKKQNR